MSNKLYKAIYIVFNFIVLLLGLYSIFIFNGGFEVLLSDWFTNILSFIIIILYIYLMIISLLNLISKKQYNKDPKTRIFRGLSIFIWVCSILKWIHMGIKLIPNKLDFYLLNTGVIITMIIMTLSIYKLLKINKKKLSIIDLAPVFVTLVFIILLLLLYNINVDFFTIGIDSFTRQSAIIYYVQFIIVPAQLVNIYNLFNLKNNYL